MADVGRITELWRAAADALENPRDPLHGWEAAAIENARLLAECGRLREQLDAARQALDPATVAESFHAHYERLAPDYGYRTREESAVPWVSVPLLKKRLMVATVTEALAAARAALGVEGE